MKITKIGHSCLIVEENETRVLVDPGTYTFTENANALEEMKDINAILITHEHPDHLDLEKFGNIIARNNNPHIYTNESVANLLKSKGIGSIVVDAGERFSVGELDVRVVDCPHGLLPEGIATPKNVGFVFNEKLFHPGDCISPNENVECEVLALPVGLMWGTLREAVEFAKSVKPKMVFNVHDGILKYPELACGVITRALDAQKAKFEFRSAKAGGGLRFGNNIFRL